MHPNYNDIISLNNLLNSWQEFLRGKRRRSDVAVFSIKFVDNIRQLNVDLEKRTYQHGGYQAFMISDPKPRLIHKASVRDRLLHHAIYRVLYPYYDRKFIFDSFSRRLNKGTHCSLNRFGEYGRIVSHNNTRTVWVLKCDIRKFFASIDHDILLKILARRIKDQDIIWLLEKIIRSFQTEGKTGVGLPLGNLTSQLLVNVYMNEFDNYLKRQLRVKYYLRYADDFIILHQDRFYLEKILHDIKDFLYKELKLLLNQNKVFVKTLASGVDFLGWVHFPTHRVLRTTTKRRMFRNIKTNSGNNETIQSYLGLLKHGNTYKLTNTVKNQLII